MNMVDTYKVTVEFTRYFEEDSELLEARIMDGRSKTLKDAAIAQLHEEIQAAFDNGLLAGHFDIKASEGVA